MQDKYRKENHSKQGKCVRKKTVDRIGKTGDGRFFALIRRQKITDKNKKRTEQRKKEENL